jgi:hypothetical protein
MQTYKGVQLSEKQISFAFSTTILSWLNFKNIW